MVRPRSKNAVVYLLAVVGRSSFVSAFVPPLSSQHGSTPSTAFRQASLPSAAIATSLAGDRRRGKGGSFRPTLGGEALWGVRNGEDEGGMTDVEEQERAPPAAARPQTAVVGASTVSGLATGAAIVALAAVGGFPDLAAAEAPAWVGPTKLILDPILLYFEVAFVARIILSWYPQLDLNSAPQNLVAWPTEPILKPTRAVVPPAFGVDISPIVWVMICSLLHEILLGQQGILNLMSNK